MYDTPATTLRRPPGWPPALLAVAVVDWIQPWLTVLLAVKHQLPVRGGRRHRIRKLSQPNPEPLALGRSYRSVRIRGRVPAGGQLLRTDTLLDRAMLYFDARPSHHQPTVKIRVADVCRDPRDTLLLAGLTAAWSRPPHAHGTRSTRRPGPHRNAAPRHLAGRSGIDDTAWRRPGRWRRSVHRPPRPPAYSIITVTGEGKPELKPTTATPRHREGRYDSDSPRLAPAQLGGSPPTRRPVPVMAIISRHVTAMSRQFFRTALERVSMEGSRVPYADLLAILHSAGLRTTNRIRCPTPEEEVRRECRPDRAESLLVPRSSRSLPTSCDSRKSVWLRAPRPRLRRPRASRAASAPAGAPSRPTRSAPSQPAAAPPAPRPRPPC